MYLTDTVTHPNRQQTVLVHLISLHRAKCAQQQTDRNKQEATYAALLPDTDPLSHLQHHDSPAPLCFSKICNTPAWLQSSVLHDENYYILQTSSKDVNELTGETACSCLHSGERWWCCKTSPNFPSSLWCRQQRPASVHAASWTLTQKHQMWLVGGGGWGGGFNNNSIIGWETDTLLMWRTMTTRPVQCNLAELCIFCNDGPYIRRNGLGKIGSCQFPVETRVWHDLWGKPGWSQREGGDTSLAM